MALQPPFRNNWYKTAQACKHPALLTRMPTPPNSRSASLPPEFSDSQNLERSLRDPAGVFLDAEGAQRAPACDSGMWPDGAEGFLLLFLLTTMPRST
jgi:hypothetical protein